MDPDQAVGAAELLSGLQALILVLQFAVDAKHAEEYTWRIFMQSIFVTSVQIRVLVYC